MTTVGDEVWSDAHETADVDEEVERTRREIEEIDGDDADGRTFHATERVPSTIEHKDYSGEIKPDGKNSAESIIIEGPPSIMTGVEESHEQQLSAAVSPPTAAVNSAPSTSARSTFDTTQTLEVPASASSVNPSPALSQHSTTSLERRSSRRRSVVDVRNLPSLPCSTVSMLTLL